jgi:hypothetical protein
LAIQIITAVAKFTDSTTAESRATIITAADLAFNLHFCLVVVIIAKYL